MTRERLDAAVDSNARVAFCWAEYARLVGAMSLYTGDAGLALANSHFRRLRLERRVRERYAGPDRGPQDPAGQDLDTVRRFR